MILSIPQEFETERLHLSRFRNEDAEEIFYTYASKPEATRFVAWPTHQTLADTRRYLRYTIEGWSAGVDYSFGIRLKRNRRLIGGTGLLNDKGAIQFGYIFGPNHWRQGFATESCIQLMALIRRIPGIRRVSTFIDAENEASGKVLLKSGLVVEARYEKWFSFVNQNNLAKDCILFNLPL